LTASSSKYSSYNPQTYFPKQGFDIFKGQKFHLKPQNELKKVHPSTEKMSCGVEMQPQSTTINNPLWLW